MIRILADDVFEIPGVLPAQECRAMIERAEASGFGEATINAADGPRVARETRNNDRVIIDDPELARTIWSRVAPDIPAIRLGRQARGLNERFRFYRYNTGQKFDWHADGAFERPNGERSLLTFMIYLNAGYDGGETRFEAGVSVRGEAGSALVFGHGLIHQGAAVTAGTKYVLRSDVMYGRVGQLRGS